MDQLAYPLAFGGGIQVGESIYLRINIGQSLNGFLLNAQVKNRGERLRGKREENHTQKSI